MSANRLCVISIVTIILAFGGQPLAGAERGGAVRIGLDAIPDSPAAELGRAAFDTTEGWENITLVEDKPMTFAAATAEGDHREGRGAVKFTLNADIGPMGMKYFSLAKLSGTAVGSDGYSFWVKGDGSGGTLEIRLSQGDWSAWDSPPVILSFTGWRQIVVLRDDCRFQNWGHNGQKWDDVKVFALRYSGRSGSLIVDDLRFYKGAAALKVHRLPAPAEAVTLRIDASKDLPAIPATLRGVDFALVNWGASGPDLNFGPATEKLFRESGAKLVRFWTYCPPLNLSPSAGKYDWTKFDAQMQKVTDAGAATIMTCCFTPAWLSVDGTKEGMPKDWAAYEKLIGDTVSHCKEKGFNVAYWEVWNEPNLNGGFLKGKMPDLLEVYRHFVKAVRGVDPTALVGGPALAGPDMVWIRGIVEYADKNDLPLDFVSWHVYDLMPDGLAASIDAAKRIVAAHPKFADTRLVIDEWQASGGPRNQYDSEYAAAYQVAALHRMLDGGVTAQTFFAFKEMTPDFSATGDQGGNCWGMITRGDIPKASYHSFKAFAGMTGARLAVSGGDGELNGIATRSGDGIDVLVYRLNSDADSGDRVVRLDLAGWTGGPVRMTMQLIDNAHSNPLFDRSTVELETVGRWGPLAPGELKQVEVSLRPVSVAKLHIAPAAARAELFIRKDAAAAPAPKVLAAGQRLDMPLWGQRELTTWSGPRGWGFHLNGSMTAAPTTQRQPRKAYFVGRSPDEFWTFCVDVIRPGVDLSAELAGAEPWKAGTSRKVSVMVRNSLPTGVKGQLSLWSNQAVRVSPATIAIEMPASGKVEEKAAAFNVEVPAGLGGSDVMIHPRFLVESLTEGKSGALSAAYPEPLALPVKDGSTILLCSMGSSDAIAKPEVGPAGAIDGPAPRFGPGKAGPGAVLKESAIRFPGTALAAQAGTLECWVTPAWDGSNAPGWGTLFLRSGNGGWAKSMWDVHIIKESGRNVLRFDLDEEDGRAHAVSADISGWKAGEPHQVMMTWNAVSGRIAIYVDAKLAEERVVDGGLSLNPGAKDVTFNRTGGRAPLDAIVGPVRISRVERIPGRELPAQRVDVRAIGLEIRAGE